LIVNRLRKVCVFVPSGSFGGMHGDRIERFRLPHQLRVRALAQADHFGDLEHARLNVAEGADIMRQLRGGQ